LELPPIQQLFGPAAFIMDGRKANTSTSSSTKTLKLAYNMTKAEEDQLKKMYYQHEIKNISTNPKIIRGLNRDIQTENEQLKYEYIEMIRSGRGEEFMKYLLSSNILPFNSKFRS
jgi:hypothetical protein